MNAMLPQFNRRCASRYLHRGLRLLGLAITIVILSRSASSPVQAETPVAPLPVQSADQFSDAQATIAERAEGTDKPRVQIFRGTGEFVRSSRSRVKAPDQAPGDITLDFSDADVHDVVRSVLGDMLKQAFVIDPQVSGHVTLKTGAPITQDAVIPALEAALKLNGDAIVIKDGMYNIVPLPAAQQRAQISVALGQSSAPGFGIEIVPLRYIAADEMQQIIEPLAPGSIVRVDTERDLIFLAGTAPERESVKKTIQLFDTDYLKGMSFALIQPRHVDAGVLATELKKIFDQTSSPIAGLVRMIPIARINTLLAITARASYLDELQKWVDRLDVVPVTPGRQLYYYPLQNARAKEVAETLNQLFAGGSAGATHSSTTIGSVQALSPTAAATRQTADATDAEQPESMPSMASDDSGPQIVTDEANNALIVRAFSADYTAIQDVIRKMDTAPDQVLVDVTIVEVTLNDQLKYGVEWYFKNADQTFTLSPTGAVQQHFPGFGFSYVVPNVQVAVSALGSLTRLSVLSSPKLLTLDNKTATLQVGDQVPVVTQTATSTVAGDAPLVSTIAQRNTGVILSVTPRIGHSGMVFLDVSQEVSDVIPTTTSGIDSPTIQERKLQSTVGIRDGTTVALGGLIRHSVSGGDSGLPYLKDIPLLGNLFSSTNDARDSTELIIFLTPRVIRSASDAATMTGNLSQKMDAINQAIKDFDEHKNEIPRKIFR